MFSTETFHTREGIWLTASCRWYLAKLLSTVHCAIQIGNLKWFGYPIWDLQHRYWSIAGTKVSKTEIAADCNIQNRMKIDVWKSWTKIQPLRRLNSKTNSAFLCYSEFPYIHVCRYAYADAQNVFSSKIVDQSMSGTSRNQKLQILLLRSLEVFTQGKKKKKTANF